MFQVHWKVTSHFVFSRPLPPPPSSLSFTVLSIIDPSSCNLLALEMTVRRFLKLLSLSPPLSLSPSHFYSLSSLSLLSLPSSLSSFFSLSLSLATITIGLLAVAPSKLNVSELLSACWEAGSQQKLRFHFPSAPGEEFTVLQLLVNQSLDTQRPVRPGTGVLSRDQGGLGLGSSTTGGTGHISLTNVLFLDERAAFLKTFWIVITPPFLVPILLASMTSRGLI